jgi:heme-degrading monooxygenase HmoA
MHVLLVNFNLQGVDERQYAAMCDQIAPAFAAVPGLVSKVWLKDSASGTYGGVYLFQDRAAFDAFKRSDLFKTVQTHPNLANINAKDFDILEAPTRVTNGLLTGVA